MKKFEELRRETGRLSWAMKNAGVAADRITDALNDYIEVLPSEAEMLRECFETNNIPAEVGYAEYIDIRQAHPEWGYIDAIVELEKRHKADVQEGF